MLVKLIRRGFIDNIWRGFWGRNGDILGIGNSMNKKMGIEKFVLCIKIRSLGCIWNIFEIVT